ncbi:MAG: 5-formyltetrahydrofolate cyclo-ligase [Pseudomonadota bacterium]
MTDSIRQKFRAKRRNLQGEARRQAELAICRRIETVCTATEKVAAYAAFDGEPNLDRWISAYQGMLALPVISDEAGVMSFHEAPKGAVQRENRLGIFEPEPHRTLIPPDTFTIMLIPLVAFDRVGTRLGMGAGYYDRYLALAPQALRIGVAFDVQCSNSLLPRHEWDEPLHQVITQTQTIEF